MVLVKDLTDSINHFGSAHGDLPRAPVTREQQFASAFASPPGATRHILRLAPLGSSALLC